MGGILKRWQQKQKLKELFKILPESLSQSYGRNETYTIDQIRVSYKRLKLDSSLLVFAYATFLTREDFEDVKSREEVTGEYEEIRTLIFDKYLVFSIGSTGGGGENLSEVSN